MGAQQARCRLIKENIMASFMRTDELVADAVNVLNSPAYFDCPDTFNKYCLVGELPQLGGLWKFKMLGERNGHRDETEITEDTIVLVFDNRNDSPVEVHYCRVA